MAFQAKHLIQRIEILLTIMSNFSMLLWYTLIENKSKLNGYITAGILKLLGVSA